MGKSTIGKLTRIARNLRRNSTEAGEILWQKIRNKQLAGVKFRRQQPIGPYVVDFVSLEKMFVIELDGGQHAIEKRKDRKRDLWLNSQGFEVLRFWNNEVFENMEGVLEFVRKRLLCPSSGAPLPPHPDPLPPGEREASG